MLINYRSQSCASAKYNPLTAGQRFWEFLQSFVKVCYLYSEAFEHFLRRRICMHCIALRDLLSSSHRVRQSKTHPVRSPRDHSGVALRSTCALTNTLYKGLHVDKSALHEGLHLILIAHTVRLLLKRLQYTYKVKNRIVILGR